MQPGSYACRPERLCRPVHHFQEDTHYAVPCRQLCISPSCCASPILPAGGCVYSPHHPQHRQPVEDTARQPCQVPAQLTCRQAPHRLLAETRALMCFCAAPGRAAESVMHMLTSCLSRRHAVYLQRCLPKRASAQCPAGQRGHATPPKLLAGTPLWPCSCTACGSETQSCSFRP